jgi:hypothetical protein
MDWGLALGVKKQPFLVALILCIDSNENINILGCKMRLPDTNKPIIREFCAAARLANEWRDTISYTLLTGVAIADLIQNRQVNPEVFGVVGMRELVRSVTWFYANEQRFVDDKSAPINNVKFALAAFVGETSGVLLDNLYRSFQQEPHIIGIAWDLFAMTVGMLVAGGPRGVLKAYTDIMWDYPRKKGGGGTTQTQKLKDGFSKWAAGFGNRAPQSAYVGVRAAVTSLRTMRMAGASP